MSSSPGGLYRLIAVAFCLILVSPSLAHADEEHHFQSAKMWIAQHDLEPTIDVLNAVQRGADRARALLGENADHVMEMYIDQSLREMSADATAAPVTARLQKLPKTTNSQATTRIDFVSPTSGPLAGGNSVILSGRSYQPGAVVTFGGVPGTNPLVSLCTQMSVVAPAGSGTVNVTVTNPDMTTFTLAGAYTYTAPSAAAVTSVTPGVGPTSGGTAVTIHGTGFTAGVSVTFTNALNSDAITVPAASVSFVDANTLTLTTPPGAGGLSNVRVSGASISATLNNAFFYTGLNLPAPTVTSFDSAATPGTTINIFGTNFVGITLVRFSTKSSLYGSTTVSSSANVLSSTHITTVVPASAVTGPIQVDGVFGAASPCAPFLVVSGGPPTIASIPASTPYDYLAALFGFTITGTNFQDVQSVEVNGLPVSFFSVLSSTSISASVAYLHPSGPVTVRTNSGVVTTAGSINVIDPDFCAGPLPTITSIPATADSNSVITINGTNFAADPGLVAFGIRFAGSRQAEAYFATSATTGDVFVFASSAGPSPLAIVTDMGVAISPTSLTINPVAAPTISSLSVTSGVRGAGVTMNGTNLNGLYEVSIGGQFFTTLAAGAASVGLAIPWAITNGSVPVVVYSLGGTASTTFNVTCGTPTISTFAPSARVGGTVSITGTNFMRSPARSAVFFNGVRSASTSAGSNTSFFPIVPRTATAGAIEIITPYGGIQTGGVFVPLGKTKTEFDADGRSDIFWHNVVTGQNYIYRMNGLSITSQDYVNTVADTAWKVAGSGDFNGDGICDVLWRNSTTGANYVYLMNGSTIASSGTINTIADPNWQVAGVGDFDGDGRADILWRNISTGANYIYFMNGLTITAQTPVNTVPTVWQVADVGDLDGDGKADIIWRNSSTGDNYVYLMTGATIASYGLMNTIADPNWKVAGVGDFNGDGKADILWHNVATGASYIYFMQGKLIVQQDYVNTVPDLNWTIAGVGDFNRDGITDILWRNTSTGQNYIYLMAGSSIGPNGTINTVADQNWMIFQ